MLDYLAARVLRLFDPKKSCGEANFSLKKIYEELNLPEKDISGEIKQSFEALKRYRNKYLSHADFTKSRRDLPLTYKKIEQHVDNLLEFLFERLEEVCGLGFLREVVSTAPVEMMSYVNAGAFIEGGEDDLRRRCHEWHEIIRQ